MKKFALLLTSLLLLGLSVAFAQTKSITGVVTSADDGSTLPGVSVVVKGTTLGITTDIDGTYTLNVPNDAKALVFSYVGMKPLEEEINGRNKINVELEPNVVDVDEVMVVAYGTKTKKSLVGAVTSVDSETIENQTSPSPLRAIQGSSPGVNVITTGGQPGENPKITIRGVGSNVNSDPLIVVDGVAFSGNINSISSDQIASVNILKDASATALYGSRASNGVLLITTKGGRLGKRKTNITVNVRAGYSEPAVDNYELVGASDYMRYAWEALRNVKLYGENQSAEDAALYATNNIIGEIGYNPFSVDKPIGVNGQIANGARLLWDTDWYSALTRKKAGYNDVTFTADGGSDDMSYFISGNRLDQKGAIIESQFTRISGRLNLKAKLTEWLEFGTNNSFSKSTQNYPDQSGSGYTNTVQWANSLSNIYPLYSRDAEGNFLLDGEGNKQYDFGNIAGRLNGSRIFSGDNAVASTYNHDVTYVRTNLFSSSFLKFKLFDWLSYKTQFGYERYVYDSNTYTHYKYGHAAQVGGRVSQGRNITETQTFINSLSFSKNFDRHNLRVDAISEVFDFNYDQLTADGTGFLPGVKVLGGSTTPESVGGYITSERLVSALGRVSYDYGEKYFIDVSYRADASTRFRSGNRWGNFYSVGGSWIISDEGFMQTMPKVSLLKVRASYGELGNNKGIGRFPYLATYDTGWNNIDNTGVLKGGFVDEDIKWEKTALFNVGLDFGFFDNRVSGTIEYYNKESVDLLFSRPLAPSVGDASYFTNIGTINNRGIEFSIQTINIDTKDLFWKTSFNISTNTNEIKKLPQEEIIAGSKKLRVGKGLYDFYIREYAGVDPDTGEPMWYKNDGTKMLYDEDGNIIYDKDGNPQYENQKKVTTKEYSEADRYYQGSSLPDFYGGFSSYLEYKGFDLTLAFNYSIGGKLLDSSYRGLMNTISRYGSQLTTDIAKRWQKPGDITDVPRLYAANNDANSRSSRFLFDNNYLRLKALTFGYNLPKRWLNSLNMRSCRIYFQADNVFTLQSHKGIDPEQNISGTTNQRSNLLRTYSLGLKIGF